MPGTDTRTGSRTSNPYLQRLQNLGETPERFLRSRNDPAALLRISQQAAREDASNQEQVTNRARDAINASQRNRSILDSNLRREEDDAAFSRRMREKQWDADQAARTRGSSFTVVTDNSAQNNFNRQKELMQLQNQQELVKLDRDRASEQQRQSHERLQQSAQLAAQQRLAQMQQDTAILTGHPGESTWRWF